MATPKYITGKVTNPDGTAAPLAKITVTLSQQTMISGTQEIAPAVINATAAADGTYTFQAYATNDMTPNNTFFTFTGSTAAGGWWTATIQVPQGVDSGGHAGTVGDPFHLTLLTTSTPTASPSPNHVSTLTVDGLSTLSGSIVEGKDFQHSAQTVTEAVLVSGVDATAGELIDVTLTANRVVGLPLNPAVGQDLVLLVTMGGTGGYKLTYPAGIKTAWQPASAVGDVSALQLRYFGTNWQQIGGQAAVSQLGVLAHRGPAVVGSLTVRDPAASGPYTPDSEAVANNGISTLFLNREFWLPSPTGTDDTAVIVATDAAAALVNGTVHFRATGATNYKYNAQITKAARWVGSASALQCTASLGAGVRSILDNYQTGQQADLALSAPSMASMRLVGPGTAPVPTAPTKTANVDGVQLNGKLRYQDVVVEYFDSGVVLHSALGHIQLDNVIANNNYYGAYQELGNQDHVFNDCDLTNNAFACFAAPGNVQVNRVSFKRTHFGYTPICYYQEANVAAAIFMLGVSITECPHENVGNYFAFSENIGQANVAGICGTFILNPGFGFSNTYKIAARPQDWAIDVGDTVLAANEIHNGSKPITNGAVGAVRVNANTMRWDIYGDSASDVWTIPNSNLVNRWGRNAAPVLGRLGTQRIAIGDSAGVADLSITDTTATAGITLATSGGNGGLRLNGTTWEWLANGLGSVHTSLNGVGALTVKDLRLTRQVPSEAVLVSGVDAASGGFIGTITLTAARVVGAPLNPVSGQRITFSFLQDGTGGWNVTWNAAFKVSWTNTGNTAAKRSSVSFVYDNFNWIQDPIATNVWL